MAMKTVAGKWLAENGDFRFENLAKWSPHKHARTEFAQHLRDKLKGQSVRDFVHSYRNYVGCDCVFVPNAIKGRPSQVEHCGRSVSAARYMALLAHGTPKDEAHVVRHTCGNGHLSCVNPNHLLWGTQAENRSDAARHRRAKTTAEKINSLFGKL